MVIALRRGVDYVPTGLYDPAAKKADGSNRFSSTDFVVKYKLTSVNPSDTNIYKNPVRIVSGSSPTKYCVVHDDGTAYVLDDYNPYNKTYQADMRDHTSSPCYAQQYSVQPIYIHKTVGKTIHRYEYTDVRKHKDCFEFILRPIGHTYSNGTHYYPVGAAKTATPFTYFYFDANGTTVEWTGVHCFYRSDVTNLETMHPRTTPIESAGFHSLFFEGEKCSFINGQLNGSDLSTWGNIVDTTSVQQIVFTSCSTLERSLPVKSIDKGMTRNFDSTSYQFAPSPSAETYSLVYLEYIVQAPDGLLQDTVTKIRYDYVVRNFLGPTYNVGFCSLQTLPDPSLVPGLNLQFITIPSVTVSDSTTISFASITPSYTTNNILYKGVDYVPTGIYNPTLFAANDLVVKCCIKGAYYKYPVKRANGSSSYYCIIHTEPGTSKQTVYTLDGFDPFERYYMVQPYYRRHDGNWDRFYIRTTSRYVHSYIPPSSSYIAPVDYYYTTTPSTYANFRINADTADVAAGPRHYYKALDGSIKEFTVFAFDDSGHPVNYLNRLLFHKPNSVRSGALQMQDLNYHQLFFAGEKCLFGNCTPDLLGRTYTDGRIGAGSGMGLDVSLRAGTSVPSTITFYAPLISSLTMDMTECNAGFGNKLREYYENTGQTHVTFDRMIVASSCGLYMNASGVRYDYVQLANRAGLYVPVESLNSMLTMAQITTDTGGFLVSRVIDSIPSYDLFSSLQTQLATAQASLSAAQTDKAAAVAAQAAADQVVIANLQSRIAAVTDVLNTASANITALDQNAIQSQIDALNTQLAATNDTNTRNLLSSQITTLTKIKDLQATLSDSTAGLTEAQANIATIITILNSSDASISDSMALQEQINALQQQSSNTTDANLQQVLSTQVHLLQQIQFVQQTLQQYGNMVNEVQSAVLSFIYSLSTTTDVINSDDPEALLMQMQALEMQRTQISDPILQGALNDQIDILSQMRTLRLSLQAATSDSTVQRSLVSRLLGESKWTWILWSAVGGIIGAIGLWIYLQGGFSGTLKPPRFGGSSSNAVLQ